MARTAMAASATRSRYETYRGCSGRQHPAGHEMSEQRLFEIMRPAFDVIAYCDRGDDGFRVRLMSEEREVVQ
jgi:hypothetical protein